MMQPKVEQSDIGVIIGRFQVDDLHDAHRDLIKSVQARSAKTVILLGIDPVPGRRRNTLDYDCRRLMVQTEFPEVTILPLMDCKDNDQWSARVDDTIRNIVGPKQSVIIYGGRKSCLPSYTGHYKMQELEDPTGMVSMSGTAVRQRLSVAAQNSRGFRAGAIWEAHQRWPAIVSVVDCAIINFANMSLLLGQKADDKPDEWRFPGGHAEPHNQSDEADAMREVEEETGVQVGRLIYVGSYNIDNWLYKYDVDKMRTRFFIGQYLFGGAMPGSDLAAIKWFTEAQWTNPASVNILEEHKILMTSLRAKVYDEEFAPIKEKLTKIAQNAKPVL